MEKESKTSKRKIYRYEGRGKKKICSTPSLVYAKEETIKKKKKEE